MKPRIIVCGLDRTGYKIFGLLRQQGACVVGVHDFVPLYVETNYQSIHSWDLLDTYLSAGDILYLTMPATGLEQLWRAAPSQLMVG